MARILVTGGAGYIGSHACKALAASGHEPIVIDTLDHGHADAVQWGPLVEADIGDRSAIDRAIAIHRPRAVMHFAAYAYVGESVADPARYYRNNVVGTATLLDACRAAGIGPIVCSSSCATYGVPDTLPIAETAPQRPISPYGRTKLMVEQVLADYAAAYGMTYMALRYFNAAGADPDGTLSERHDPETHLIPNALRAAAGELPHLELFGDDYPTADGTCIRDYVHVSDLASAHVAALEDLLAGGTSAAINLGTGRGVSTRDILKVIERVTGQRVPVLISPRRPGDPPALLADPTLANVRLGFVPRYSDIDSIVRTAAPTFGVKVIA